MQNKILSTIIIMIFFSASIISQSPGFRKANFFHWSVGGNVYGPNGSSTSVPEETYLYNIANSYTGEDSVYMYETNAYPSVGNAWYQWHNVFDGITDDIYGDYIDVGTNNIFIIKTCYTVSGMTDGWGLPADTIHYDWKSQAVFRWHVRSILKIMEAHPDKFFVMWNLVPVLNDGSFSPSVVANDNIFSTWMKDTLATGLDATYGDFPDNVYIFDVFHILDSSNYMPLSLSVSPSDNHLNAAGTELVAPLFVNEVFNAAIAYESIIAVEEVEVDFNPITTYTLEQNYPNPFNPSTEINFTLAKSGYITLKVYDSLGSLVATLIDGFMTSGKHSVKFSPKDTTSGIYFYRLKVDNFTSTRKMLLLK